MDIELALIQGAGAGVPVSLLGYFIIQELRLMRMEMSSLAQAIWRNLGKKGGAGERGGTI
jgi:hypothetical protein